MWVFSKQGFVSIVEDRQAKDDHLLVRSRFKGDIENLFKGAKVERHPDRDYLFRASIPRHDVANVIARHIMSIDYDNFKDSTPKDRHPPYMQVWQVLMQEQKRRVPKSGYYVPCPLPQYQNVPFDDYVLAHQYRNKKKKGKQRRRNCIVDAAGSLLLPGEKA